VYYFGEMMTEHPRVLAACDQMLPEDTQTEDSGVGRGSEGGGVKGAAADAAARAAAKAAAKTRNAALGNDDKKLKRTEKNLTTAAKVAMGAVKDEFKKGDGFGAWFGAPAGPALAGAPDLSLMKQQLARLRKALAADVADDI